MPVAWWSDPPDYEPPPVTGWWAELRAHFQLAVTPVIGMVGGAQSAATFGLTITPTLTMAAVERYGRAFEIAVTPAIGMVGGSRTPASFTLAVTPAVGMNELQPPIPAAVELAVTPIIGMVGVEHYARAFQLAVTPTIGMVGGLPLAHYTDNFNRSDSATLGANWTSYDMGLGTQFRILNNTAAVSASFATNGFDLVLSEYNTALLTNDHKVQVTVPATKPDQILLTVRGNGTDYVYANFIDASTWEIGTATGDTGYLSIGSATSRAMSAASESFSATDVLSFEADGNSYAIKRNGSTIVSWPDTGGAYSSFVNSSHRKVAVMAIALSSASQAVDDFDAQDLP